MKRWYEDSVGLRLIRAARLHRSRAQSLLSDIGLHPGQETVLQILMGENGQPMSALAGALKVRPPTVTKMVTRMAAQGLVRRVAAQSDGRSTQVYLTDEGRRRALALKELWKRLEGETLRDLDSKDRKRLARLLEKVTDGLSFENASAEAGVDARIGEPSGELHNTDASR